MMFFEQLAQFGERVALQDTQQRLTYAQLDERCNALQVKWVGQKRLMLIDADNKIETVIAYLACLRGGHACMLIDPELAPRIKQSLIASFNPNMVHTARGVEHRHDENLGLAKNLALLLPTSGSTGASKHVALSYQNIHSNAQSICDYLPIIERDRCISSLPLFYAYGLSVIHSHLYKGACIFFSPHSVMSRGFWDTFEQENITSLVGVPYTYDMLLKLRFTRMALPSLRYFTQAGGKLAESTAVELAKYADHSNRSFYVMYGQTEATARIAYARHDKILRKGNTIGKVIPGGKLWLQDDTGNTIDSPGVQGELVYQGDNVMLGYAQHADDLVCFTHNDVLHTGDLASFDEQGDFFISGRKSRFVKLLGQRVGLDELESLLLDHGFRAYCFGTDNTLVAAVEQSGSHTLSVRELSEMLRIHHSVLTVLPIDTLPVSASGKKDYQCVMAMWEKQHGH